jgi:hypothetical protein
MRYKPHVQQAFPNAHLVTIDRWNDGSPRYQRVVFHPPEDPTGEAVIVDIHDGTGQQGATAAWRSAKNYWIVRANAALRRADR